MTDHIENAKKVIGLYCPARDLFTVGVCKTLGNWKGIFASPSSSTLYEVTYSGANCEYYLDVYVKALNYAVPLETVPEVRV